MDCENNDKKKSKGELSRKKFLDIQISRKKSDPRREQGQDVHGGMFTGRNLLPGRHCVHVRQRLFVIPKNLPVELQIIIVPHQWTAIAGTQCPSVGMDLCLLWGGGFVRVDVREGMHLREHPSAHGARAMRTD